MQQEWSGPCLQVRRSGKFGGADEEQKEENSASWLGSEIFLLASSQKEVPLAKLQKLAHILVTHYIPGIQFWKKSYMLTCW